jgi:hypothetical protein
VFKNRKAEVTDRFNDGRRRRQIGNSSACYKMGNYHPTLMKIGSQTKKNMLSSKVTKRKLTAKKQQKLNVKTISFQKGNVVCARSYKKAKILYSLPEASILIQQVIRQSYFEFPYKVEAVVHACIQGF